MASNLIRQLHAGGILTVVNILLNLPHETVNSLERERKHIEDSLSSINFLFINYLMPMPGTEFYNREDPRHRWYLQTSLCKYKMSYYQMCMIVSNPALEINPFALPGSTLHAIERFKEKLHMQSALKLNASIIFRFALRCDFILARLSRNLARHSPKMEDVIFRPLKIIRPSIYKFVFGRIGKAAL